MVQILLNLCKGRSKVLNWIRSFEAGTRRYKVGNLLAFKQPKRACKSSGFGLDFFIVSLGNMTQAALKSSVEGGAITNTFNRTCKGQA